MNVTVGKKLMAGFAVVLLLTAFAGLLGSTSLKTVSTSYQLDIARQYHLTQLAEKMVSDLLQVRRSEKDFIVHTQLKKPGGLVNS